MKEKVKRLKNQVCGKKLCGERATQAEETMAVVLQVAIKEKCRKGKENGQEEKSAAVPLLHKGINAFSMTERPRFRRHRVNFACFVLYEFEERSKHCLFYFVGVNISK